MSSCTLYSAHCSLYLCLSLLKGSGSFCPAIAIVARLNPLPGRKCHCCYEDTFVSHRYTRSLLVVAGPFKSAFILPSILSGGFNLPFLIRFQSGETRSLSLTLRGLTYKLRAYNPIPPPEKGNVNSRFFFFIFIFVLPWQKVSLADFD